MGYYKEKIKNLLLTLALLFIFLVGFNFEANGAYCNNIASTVAITPTSTSQNTNTYTSGRRAFTFNATAGSTYTFSTCGNTSVDTYLRLYSGNGGTLLVSNDDDCGLQSTISWTCTTTDAYSILLTRYTCNNLNGSTFMSYSVSDPVVEPNIVQLGDPNSSTSDGRVPSYGYYDYSWSGLIYTATEVGAPITINELQFDVKNSVSLTMTNQKIYMAHTTLDVFPNGNEPISSDATTSDWILVYSGAITWNEGWNPITLDNEFSYNGSGNVLIKTTNEHGSYTFNYPEFRYTAKSNSVVYNYNDGTFPNSSGYRNEYRPNMKFGFSGGGSLPIELIDFNAIMNEDRVEITWTTASEINNDYFIVERSEDALDWIEVIKISGAGHSVSIIDYFEIDKEPLSGLSYYRLTQVDFDGEQETFNIIPVENAIKGEGIMNIYPNPVNKGECISLSFESLHLYFDEILVVLRDIKGNEAYSIIQFVDCKDGLVVIDIPRHLASGTYLVVATSENLLFSKKIIIK